MSKFLWTQRSNFGPAARVSHAMTFDSNRSSVTFFAQIAGTPLVTSVLRVD